MSTVRESIEVAVPADVAYEGLSHFENYPRFMSGVMNLTPLTDTTAHMVLDLAGNRAEFDACITESRPGEFLCWEAMDGPQLSETLRLEEIDDSTTRIIAELQIDARQMMPSEEHHQDVLNRRLKADLVGFKRFCEEAPTTSMTGIGGTTGRTGIIDTNAPKKLADTSATTRMPMNRPSPATIARGIAAANERPAKNMPPTANRGPVQNNSTRSMQGRPRGK
jgi:hypothetical protein